MIEKEPTNAELDLAALGSTWTPANTLDATPEVSDVLAALPWWVSRGLLYLIVGFIFVGLLWAYFSVLDVVIEARGKLIPEGDVRPVQAATAGIVQFVRVREGDTVTRGQTLLQLDTTELRARLNKLGDELTTSEEQLRQLRAVRGPATETLDRQNRIAQLKSDIATLEQALSHTTITAPVSGIITRLDVKSVRAVVQSGQSVAAIAPAGARLVVEANVPNKDIAFLEKGMPAKLKFDAFPFQDYGIVAGQVVEVAPDAQASEQLGSFYKVTILPQDTAILAHGKQILLRPGLAVSAEIVTERKSVLALLLEPFRKLKGEVGKEQ
ncbi:MAG: HlyD family efflux transporter periplasmic adaptor subunit [Blastocatellia bacterium]